jgi:hypothetical protein
LSPTDAAKKPVEGHGHTGEVTTPNGSAGVASDWTALNGIRDYAEYRFKTSGVLAGLSATAFAVLLSLSTSSTTSPQAQPWLVAANLVATYNDVSRTLAAVALAFATLGFIAVSLSGHSVVRLIETRASGNIVRTVETGASADKANGYEEEADGWITLGFLWLLVALCLIAFRINVFVGSLAIVWTVALVFSMPKFWRHVKDTLWGNPPIGPICSLLAPLLLVIWLVIMIYVYGTQFGLQWPDLLGLHIRIN